MSTQASLVKDNPTGAGTALDPKLSAPLLVFTMHYTGGKNPHSVAKNFKAADLPSAIARAKRYCESMRFRFVRVDPFLSDLDAEEEKELG